MAPKMHIRVHSTLNSALITTRLAIVTELKNPFNEKKKKPIILRKSSRGVGGVEDNILV